MLQSDPVAKPTAHVLVGLQTRPEAQSTASNSPSVIAWQKVQKLVDRITANDMAVQHVYWCLYTGPTRKAVCLPFCWHCSPAILGGLQMKLELQTDLWLQSPTSDMVVD